MRLAHGVAHTCDGFLDRVLCIAGALVFAQGPEFIQQYAQRLGGHVDEVQRQVDQYRNTAEQSHLTLDQFVHQTATNADPAVARLSVVMNDAVDRLQHLREAQSALLDAPVFSKPIVFFQHFDAAIARATWSIYKPALPTTLEGVVYALVGMLIVLTVYHFLFRVPVRAGYRRWRRNDYPVTV